MADRLTHQRARLLRAVQRSGTASQGDLARATHLSASSVSILCRQLQAEGVLEFAPGEPAGAGRPPTRIRLAAAAGDAIGISVDERQIAAVRTNLRGEVVARAEHPLGACPDGKALTAAVVQAAEPMSRQGAPPADVLALGVALAGVVDFTAGVFRFSGRFPGPRDVRLRDALASRFGRATAIDDLSRARAIAEQRFGVARGARDFLYVHADMGIGAGLFLDGRPYRGARGLAGEIGHLVVETDGPWCSCGQRGCLEAVATPAALERTVRAMSVPSLAPSWPAIVAAAHAGDRAALNLLQYAAERLGQGIASAVNLFGVDLVVLGGCLPDASPQMIEVVRQVAARACIAGVSPTIRCSELDRDAGAQGAAALALDELFATDDHPLALARWQEGRADG